MDHLILRKARNTFPGKCIYAHRHVSYSFRKCIDSLKSTYQQYKRTLETVPVWSLDFLHYQLGQMTVIKSRNGAQKIDWGYLLTYPKSWIISHFKFWLNGSRIFLLDSSSPHLWGLFCLLSKQGVVRNELVDTLSCWTEERLGSGTDEVYPSWKHTKIC